MRNFVMFFHEKEGTSPIVRLLDGFPGIDVIHHADGRGWEPFDTHNCGRIPLDSLITCLDLLFGGGSVDEVNEVYERTATGPLADYAPGSSIGFKMRFQPPRLPSVRTHVRAVDRVLVPRVNARARERFATAMIDLLVRHDVLVLLAVRQDLFRWALSKYHGDGTAQPGHLQFRLADGQLRREEIPRIRVEPSALERTIQACEAAHANKRRLAHRLREAGLDVLPVRYEDFLTDDVGLFDELLRALGHDVPEEEIGRHLAGGAGLERVHGDDLSEFFVNADELVALLGDRFASWT